MRPGRIRTPSVVRLGSGEAVLLPGVHGPLVNR
jgi:hypothetical protein